MEQDPPAAQATHHIAPPQNDATATTATSDASGASVTVVAAVDDALEYSLTVGQAAELFASMSRKVPAPRTIQNYCDQGLVAAKKITTSYGSEWLINDKSLLAFITDKPELSTIASAPPPAAPATHHVATPHNDAAATTATSDAGGASDGDIARSAQPVGETRKLSDVLIENARLLADRDGKDQLIAELRNDKQFLREEVVSARSVRGDLKSLTEKMLNTIQAIALAEGLNAGRIDMSTTAPTTSVQNGERATS